MPAVPPPDCSPLAGAVPGSLIVALVLFVLRVVGLAPLPAYGAAVVLGLGVALGVSRRRAGEAAAQGMTATLTLAYSLLIGVLVTFLLAVLGLG